MELIFELKKLSFNNFGKYSLKEINHFKYLNTLILTDKCDFRFEFYASKAIDCMPLFFRIFSLKVLTFT